MAVLFSDNFNRANGGLGANWTTVSGTSGFTITSNQAAPTSGTTASYYSAAAGPSDGYVKITVATNVAAPNYLGLGFRFDPATFNGYYLGIDTAGATLFRIDGGVPTAVGAASFTPPTNGTVIEIRFTGSSISVYYNGVLQVSRTDGTYTSGRAWIFGQGTAARVDNFEAGTLSLTGVGASSVAISATAVGRAIKRATGAASFAFGSAGAGNALAKATGAASIATGASAVGLGLAKAAGSASFSFGAAGTGRALAKAAGSASISFAGTGIGQAVAKAAGSAAIEFIGVGIAESPESQAVGAAALAFDATAVGRTVVRAVGSASFAFAGDALGQMVVRAAGSASITFVGTAVGLDANAPSPPAPAPAPAPVGHPTGHRVAVRVDGKLYIGSYAEIAKIIADRADADAKLVEQEATSRTVAKREARRFSAALRQRVAVEAPMAVVGFDASVVADRMFRDLRDVYYRQLVDAIIVNRQINAELAARQLEQEMLIKQRRKLADEQAAMAAAELLLMN